MSNPSTKSIIASNSFWLLLEKIILMGGGLGLSIVFARVLGPNEFGKYNYVLSFVALFAPIFALGMYNVLLREFAKQPQKIPDIIATCRNSRVIAGASIGLLTLVVLFLVYGLQWKFQLIGLLLVANISCAFEVYERWFQHKSYNKYLVYWRVTNFLFFAALKLFVIWHYQAFMPLLMVVALEVVVKNVGYKLLYDHFDSKKIKGQFDRATFTDIFSQSKFLIFSSLASVIYLKIDILMLESMVSEEQVGIYSVAARLSEVWYVLPSIAITAVFPKLLEIANNSQQQYHRMLQRGFDLLFMCALALSLLIFVIAPWVVELLYGDRYWQAAEILQLHVFASLFIYMRALLSQWLVSQKLAEFSLFSQVSGAVANVGLNLWLIPLYGAWGAAVATVVSYSVSSYFCLFFFARTRLIAMMMTKAMFLPLRLHKMLKEKP